ncbi:MAG: MMPL family transporter [Alphaproteobacteria bacterium]|nr:MMPL family transporter [Alphaproteobacteria bacterium]
MRFRRRALPVRAGGLAGLADAARCRRGGRRAGLCAADLVQAGAVAPGAGRIVTPSPGNGFSAILAGWVARIAAVPWIVLGLAVLATALSVWLVAARLSIDTDTDDMLSAELPFRQDSRRIDAAFPQLTDNIVVVIDAPGDDAADDAAEALAARLRAMPNLFRSVFYPEGEPFFRRNGLLYLDEAELLALTDRLAAAQAFIGRLWVDPSLRGLAAVLTLALDNAAGTAPPTALAPIIEKVAAVTEAQKAGRPAMLSWRAILTGAGGEGNGTGSSARRIVVVQPALDYGTLAPAGDAIDAIRAAAKALNLTRQSGIAVRLTGSAPLAEDELASVARGMGFAGAMSLSLVVILLLWGLRSFRLMLITMITLLMGLVWTAAFATLAVGRLNLISVAFAVLFIGLSVDFGIHFVLRFREAQESGTGSVGALRRAAESVGGSLTLCAAAAAIGFLSFVPTDYVGLAELGLIAAGGMAVALVANLTVVPALLTVLPPKPARWVEDAADEKTGAAAGWIVRHRRGVLAAAGLLALGAAALLPGARFDFDPLNLKDPKTESVRTLFDIMEGDRHGPYSIEVLTPSLDAARSLASRLEALKTVAEARTLADYIPSGQEDKLIAIQEAGVFLLPSLTAPRRPPPGPAARVTAVASLRAALARAEQGEGRLAGAASRLDDALEALGAAPETLESLEARLLASLPARLEALKTSLGAEPVTVDSLPEALRGRAEAADGQALVEVYPAENLRDHAALRRFVADVRSVAPRASGTPVIILEAGRSVTRAFVEAAAISVVAIGLLIGVLLGRLREVFLVFTPLTLAALLTVAASVLLRLPFNFANVIVLPLLFGLGVASAVHLVMRARHQDAQRRLFRTSTPRAVVFSALTTIGSFASLGFSGHPGTASMGMLLTVAISLTLACTLVVLPALMAALGMGEQERV